MRITLRTVVWLVLATAAAGFVGLGLASLRPSEDELAVEHTAPAESLPISAKDYDFGAIRWGPEHDWGDRQSPVVLRVLTPFDGVRP